MGRPRRKPRKHFAIEAPELPTPEQLANGNFERDFITHAETNTKAMAYRRRDSSIIETWVREAGPGFDYGAARVIADCQTFWSRMGDPRVTANYGERIASSTHGEGYTLISGTRKPPASWGPALWCQLRNGWCDLFAPWPIATTRWVHDGTPGDVVAVRKVED